MGRLRVHVELDRRGNAPWERETAFGLGAGSPLDVPDAATRTGADVRGEGRVRPRPRYRNVEAGWAKGLCRCGGRGDDLPVPRRSSEFRRLARGRHPVGPGMIAEIETLRRWRRSRHLVSLCRFRMGKAIGAGNWNGRAGRVGAAQLEAVQSSSHRGGPSRLENTSAGPDQSRSTPGRPGRGEGRGTHLTWTAAGPRSGGQVLGWARAGVKQLGRRTSQRHPPEQQDTRPPRRTTR